MKIIDSRVFDEFGEHLWTIKSFDDDELFYIPSVNKHSRSEILGLAELLKSNKENVLTVEESLLKENIKLKKQLKESTLYVFILFFSFVAFSALVIFG